MLTTDTARHIIKRNQILNTINRCINNFHNLSHTKIYLAYYTGEKETNEVVISLRNTKAIEILDEIFFLNAKADKNSEKSF